MDLLHDLNNEQREAVLHTEGPLLILAGAGSGKTRVITHRIAYLIKEKGIDPSSILAFTFTNKAANEMKDRVGRLVGDMADRMWIGTFHATCVRILRNDIEKVGLRSGFAIFDSTDQLSLIKSCLRDLNYDEKMYPPKYVQNEISNAKNELIDPAAFERMTGSDFRRLKIAEIYKLYQTKLIQNNAMDFDDIIAYAIRLLRENPPVLKYYNNKFRYIHVDEYQDTNIAQFVLIKLLSRGSGNLCVVGDDDQSIYGFRGARIENILEFEKEYKNTKVIKLEQNYRSTENILNTANSVIRTNRGRKPKTLWTENESGSKTFLCRTENEHEEGMLVATEILNMESRGDINFKDAAVLYRTNAQSRVIEEMLRRSNIPYKVLAGQSFYQRKEIKDTLAYLRLINNPSGDLDLKRIINVPRRGIGDATVEKMERAAAVRQTGMLHIAKDAKNIPELARSTRQLGEFTALIDDFLALKDNIRVSELVERVINDSGMIAEYQRSGLLEDEYRIDNMRELISAALEFERSQENQSLDEFLSGVSLSSDTDGIDNENSVLLMTLHSAKGLEFPVVFIVGMEDGLFPGNRSITDEKELEEERRLCYVGITRAKKRLYLVHTNCRTLYGTTSYNSPSRFLDDIPSELTDHNKGIRKKYYSDNDAGTQSAKMKTSGFGFQLYKGGKPISLGDIGGKCEQIKFIEGDIVKHKKFGTGKIVSAQKDGEDTVLEIVFGETGMKRLLASLAKLEKVKE